MRRLSEIIINILAIIILLVSPEVQSSLKAMIFFVAFYGFFRVMFQAITIAFEEEGLILPKKLNSSLIFVSYISSIILLFVPIFIGMNIGFGISITFVGICTNCFHLFLKSVDVPYPFS